MIADRTGHLLLARAVAVVALVLGLVVALALPAQAASSGNQITRYDVVVDLTADGTMNVAVDFDFDFGDDPGHGPFLTLPTVQRYDREYDRELVYSNFSVGSDDAAAAPSESALENANGWLELRIGDPDKSDVEGVHRYTVSYTMQGLANPAATTNAGDELYWNVMGDQWEIPLAHVSVTINGPGTVQRVACFAGPTSSTDQCAGADSAGVTARFTQAALEPGQQLTIVAGYAPGTLTGAAPLLRERWSLARAMSLTPWTGVASIVVLLGGLGLVLGRIRQRGRDDQYLDQVPGLMPLRGQPGGTRPRDRRTPIAVHFTPPAGFRPGQLGTLIDERADPRDVTATIVDLAVRGYLRIEQVAEAEAAEPGADWVLAKLRDADADLQPFERTLFTKIFATHAAIRLSDLKTTFAASMAAVQSELYDDVTSRGWFRANPKKVRTRWYLTGLFLTTDGLVLGVVLALFTHWALVGVALTVVGITVLAVAHAAPARTATGTAVLAQTLGFRQYLATAEAEQLRFEEGEDLFSRYLPFAIVFGLTERWAAVFARLAAQGRAVAEPGWYSGPGYTAGAFWFGASSFGHAMEGFSAIANASISAATPGSDGGSGFSGGFSGGGGGGGGGGGW